MESKAKDYLLSSIKAAISGLQERNFNNMKRLVTRLHSTAEIFPDAEWTSELNLVCLTIVVVGVSTEQEITRMKKRMQI